MIELRALEPEDLELIYEIENDPCLRPWSAGSTPCSRYAVRRYLETQQGDIYLDGQLRLIVMLDGHPVGIADLTGFEPHHLRAEVGIVILSAYHRKGIAKTVLCQMARYATHTLHLRSLYAYVAQDNAAAQALFRAQGYTAVGTLRRWIEGETDAMLFQLLL